MLHKNHTLKAVYIILIFSFCSTANSYTYPSSEKQNTILTNSQLIDNPSYFDFSPQAESIYKKSIYQAIFRLIKNNKIDEAESRVSNLLKNSTPEAEIFNLKALIAISKKDIKLAITNYKKAIELNPEDLLAHTALANVFFDSKKITEASNYANKALTINKKSTIPYKILSKIAENQDKLQEAKNILLTGQKNVRGEATLEIEIATSLGDLYISEKQPQKVLTIAQDIANRYPSNNATLDFLVRAQLANKQTKQAEQTLRQLIKQDTSDSKHRLVLISLLINSKKNEEEILPLLNEVSLIDPNNIQTLITTAALLTKLKHYPEALKTADEIKRLSPNTGIADQIKGKIYIDEKKYNQALSLYRKIYRTQPTKKTLFKIIDILMIQNKHQEAISLLDKELNKDNNNVAAHYKLATIYQQQQNLDKSENHYKKVIDALPNNTLALNNLAWLYYEHNLPEAISLAKKAYELDPKSANIIDTYGSILIKQKKFNQGIEILQKGVKLAPKNYNIQYHLAQAYSKSNQNKLALEILNRILKNEHNFTEKKLAQLLFNKLSSNQTLIH